MSKARYNMGLNTQFRCNVKAGANPCIYDSRYDNDVNNGTIRGKVIRVNRFVRFNNTTQWVDPAARKHFEPVNDAARKLNDSDYKRLKSHLQGKGVSVPDDATLSELGEHFDRLDERLRIMTNKHYVQKKRKFDTMEQPEPTNNELKAEIDKLGGKYPPTANKAQLKEILKGLTTGKE